MECKNGFHLHKTTSYSLIFLKSAFLQSWVGAVSVFSADEERSTAKVFAKLCSDTVNTMNVVSRS